MTPPPPVSLKLWPADAPGARGRPAAGRPRLTYYRPGRRRDRSAALVILPGGSYRFLADHEGAGYARWLSGGGYHAFVLDYRLGSDGCRHPVMLADAARAVRFVRHHAARWGIDPAQVGVIGSSAGGHLAALLATSRDDEFPSGNDAISREDARPALVVLCYPVITMGAFGHAESRRQLLGARPSAALCRAVSAERRVNRRTPPCFIWHTVADEAVPVENSLAFARALRRQRIPFELHLFQEGGHGLGLSPGHSWSQTCLRWIGRRFAIDPA